MERRTKPKPLEKLIRERAFESGDLQLACAERDLRILLTVWLAIRILTSAALLIFTHDWLQLLAAAVCAVFAKLLYLSKAAAVLALLGGVATVWQVFDRGFFDMAAQPGRPLMWFLGAMLLLTGILQTAVMGYILASRRLPAYYAFAQAVREDWRGQLRAYRGRENS